MSNTDKTAANADPIPPGDIVFYEFFQPPLESGDYEVVVQKKVESTKEKATFSETFENGLTFAVKGIRFQVGDNDVHTTFPPKRGQGEYDNVLPHLVFNQKTLPWQRFSGIAQTQEGPFHPWMALLVFDQDDPVPELQKGNLSNIIPGIKPPPKNPATLPPHTFCYPGMQQEYGEKGDDLCQFIDVPLDLFVSIAPTSDELPWLTTARKINQVTNKSLNSSGKTPPTDFSVVVGNRLPKPGNTTTCHLVSLEGISELLTGNASSFPAGTTHVRLISLHHWSFSAMALKESFSEYLINLDKTPATLQVPLVNTDSPEASTLSEALSMGYTAVPHHTRQGANTISWYRGPLLPFQNELNLNPPLPSADALVKYNPDTGMFDTSLSAAWNLGRLLTLNSKQIATLIYNWKRDHQQQSIEAFEKELLAGQLNIDAAALDTENNPMHHQLLHQFVKPVLSQVLQNENTSND